MVNNKKAATKLKEDQSLTVLVAPEKPRYGIRRADWDRMKKNIKKSLETYGDFTFLQKSYWVLGTFSLTLIPTTLSLWFTLGVTRLVIAYLTLTLCFLVFTIVLYLVGKRAREYKTDRIKEVLEDMNELEESFKGEPKGLLSLEDVEIVDFLKSTDVE